MKKLLILMALVCGLYAPAQALDADTVSLADIRTWVRDILGSGDAGGLWTNTVLNSQINLNCREYATIVGIPKEDTILTAVGTTTYDLGYANYGVSCDSCYSDFWTVRGVLILENGRVKALKPKAIIEYSPAKKAIGEENVDQKPVYFAIKRQQIIIDPPSADSGDTLIVTYNAYATVLDSDTVVTNIPYGGIPAIVWGTVLNAMVINRESNFCQLMIPVVQGKYSAVFNAVKAQETNSSDYDPSIKATP
jgi:hypothetical protein